jgi:hypothetical protein
MRKQYCRRESSGKSAQILMELVKRQGKFVNAHDVRCNDRLVVLSACDFAKVQEIPDNRRAMI